MIEELHKWLELHAHLRDWPNLKNAKAAVEAKINEIEAKLGPKPAKAIPAPADDEDKVERRL